LLQDLPVYGFDFPPGELCCKSREHEAVEANKPAVDLITTRTEKGNVMKLPLISASLVAYVLLAVVLICYSELVRPTLIRALF
jgi:hypothetical protein